MTIENLTDTEAMRRTEYGRRKKPYTEQTVNQKLRSDHEGDGWLHLRDLKTGAKMRKPKSHDEVWENRVWCMLYQLGYPTLNVGRKFQIPIADEHGKLVTKQIDVFARDEETVIVFECKSCEEPTDRDLRKDIAEFSSLRKPFSNAIRKHFGNKPKILWAFVTRNVIWSKTDLALAASHNIAVIRDAEVRYLEEISKALGAAGRYQFHAEFFRDQKIPELDGKSLPAIATKFGPNRAFIFCVNPLDLLKIAFVNHRDLRDPAGAPSYQRLLKQGRLTKIAAYLDAGNVFPNSVLVSFHKKVRFDMAEKSFDKQSQVGTLYLPNSYKSAWIIDGQHRLYGCAMADSPPASITVIAFEKIPPTLEANLFATINREQQRVQKRLLDELDGELKWDSPIIKEKIGAIASRAIDQLKAETGGPFYDHFCPPGIAESEAQNLTLPMIRLAIVQSGLLGRPSKSTDSLLPGAATQRSSEESLSRLVDLLSWYFAKVRDANPERWERSVGGYLRTNTGVAGHVRLLGEVCTFMQSQTSQQASELSFAQLTKQVEPYLSKVLKFVEDADDTAFSTKFKVPFGSGGPSIYYFELCRLVQNDRPAFNPPGLTDHVAEMSADVVEEAERRCKWIVETVHEYVSQLLEENKGDNWFQEAIASKEIKKRAFEKMMELDASDQKSLHAYLDFTDLRTVVEQKENWPLFADVLNIPLPGEKGRAKSLEWFERVGKVKRLLEQAVGRKLGEEDATLLAYIEEQLLHRLPEEVSGG